MDLWVRSQDKKRLTKCRDFDLQEKIQGRFAVLGGKYTNHILGTYKSRQRALEVLDEIQKLLIGDILVLQNFDMKKKDQDTLEKKLGVNTLAVAISDYTEQKVDFINRDCIVYEMPQE